MNWGNVAQTIADILSVILLLRLLKLRLRHVYGIFCAFLAYDLAFSATSWLEELLHNARFDYRITWLIFTAIGWLLSLWLVYALLRAILVALPGILRFSTKLLNITFVSVIIVSLLTMRLDREIAGNSGYLSKFIDPLGKAVGISLGLDRVISTVALLVLVLILVFAIWFQVPMSRNLAAFSIGLVIYFAANSAVFLTRGMWSREALWAVSILTTYLTSACYAYWIFFITREGEAVQVTIGHRWRRQEQDRLLTQLEAMNATLLQAARR